MFTQTLDAFAMEKKNHLSKPGKTAIALLLSVDILLGISVTT